VGSNILKPEVPGLDALTASPEEARSSMSVARARLPDQGATGSLDLGTTWCGASSQDMRERQGGRQWR
jgi:hypothetical protein